MCIWADDNFSDTDSKIDVGGDTDDNSGHYIDDEPTGSPDSGAHSPHGSGVDGKGSKHGAGADCGSANHASGGGQSANGGNGSSKRKKKTRTVFSRSQVSRRFFKKKFDVTKLNEIIFANFLKKINSFGWNEFDFGESQYVHCLVEYFF